MRRIGIMAVAAVTCVSGAAAQERPQVRYEMSFPDVAHHRARIVATWRSVPPGPLRVQMARSSPGRYALHEFAKNVYDVTAADGAGRPLPVIRDDPYGWSVAGHDGTVRVSYTLFGDRGDGTYVQIDATHAHVNPPAALMWATGYDAAPVTVRIVPADRAWRIATQLPPVAGQANTFAAPNLQFLMDSPIEASAHDLREWTVGDGKDRYTVRLAVHHPGTPAQVDAFAARVRRLLPQHRRLFGEWPRFDDGSYTFLADYMPQVNGDGMEHRDSTSVSEPSPFDGNDAGKLGTVSHEFIHAWNVERLRPRELEPFDFTRANATPSLWLAEGFTSYYGPLLIRRAGLSDVDALLDAWSGMVGDVVQSPARRVGGPQEMSLRAPFADAAAAIDPVAPDIYLSYYPYGAVIALALDLSIRQRFPALSLDDYMRHLWRTFGRTERPYGPDDLRRALGEVTGDAAFADRFFAASIQRGGLPDFGPLLAQAGLALRPVAASHGWIGADRVTRAADGVVLRVAPTPGSPLDGAGLDRGDRIIALNGAGIAGADWAAVTAGLTPGATVAVRYARYGSVREATVRAVADPRLSLVRIESVGGKPTRRQLAFRAAWLGGR